MKSKAHSKKCQEMGVLVSSLLDLEAEEGKIFHLINLLLLLREGGTRPGRRLLRRSSFQRCGAILFTPSSFPAPRGGFCLHGVGYGPSWGVHQPDGLSPCVCAGGSVYLSEGFWLPARVNGGVGSILCLPQHSACGLCTIHNHE